MRLVALLVVLLAGCGRRAFDPLRDADPDGADRDALADAPADAPGIDAPFVCGDFSQMADDFDGAGFDAAKWVRQTDAGTSITETAGVARLSLADSMPNLHYAQLVSACQYDGRGRQVTVTVAGTPRSDPSSEMALCLMHIDTTFHQFCIDEAGGTLIALLNNGTGGMVLTSRAYNPTSDHLWRIRESGGATFLETSPTGGPWAVFHSLASPIDMSSVQIDMLGGTFASVPSPGTADFDDLTVQ